MNRELLLGKAGKEELKGLSVSYLTYDRPYETKRLAEMPLRPLVDQAKTRVAFLLADDGHKSAFDSRYAVISHVLEETTYKGFLEILKGVNRIAREHSPEGSKRHELNALGNRLIEEMSAKGQSRLIGKALRAKRQ